MEVFVIFFFFLPVVFSPPLFFFFVCLFLCLLSCFIFGFGLGVFLLLFFVVVGFFCFFVILDFFLPVSLSALEVTHFLCFLSKNWRGGRYSQGHPTTVWDILRTNIVQCLFLIMKFINANKINTCCSIHTYPQNNIF